MNPPCRQFDDLLMDSFDGVLSDADRRTFESHLLECPDCVATMKDLIVQRSTLRGVYGEDEEIALPEPIAARFVAAMVTAKNEPSSGSTSIRRA